MKNYIEVTTKTGEEYVLSLHGLNLIYQLTELHEPPGQYELLLKNGEVLQYEVHEDYTITLFGYKKGENKN